MVNVVSSNIFTNRFGQVTFKDVSFMMFNMFIMVFLSNSLYPDFENILPILLMRGNYVFKYRITVFITYTYRIRLWR